MRGLRARRDGSKLIFRCDDCNGRFVQCSFTGKILYGTTVKGGAWSVTQRKQRCPDCTLVARTKGWVA